MLQQTRASECHCCLMVKYLSQLHEQFISPVPLVQFNWYCERRGDNDEALTLGRDLINLLFSQRCLQTFFIFLSRAVASLADVFEKNEKKNKTTSVYRLSFLCHPGFNRYLLKCRAFSPPWSCTGVLSQFVSIVCTLNFLTQFVIHSFFYIRMLFFRPRLSILIFLPILG